MTQTPLIRNWKLHLCFKTFKTLPKVAIFIILFCLKGFLILFIFVLAIFLGSFKASFEEIRDAIYQVEDSVVTENALENLIKFLPSSEQVRSSIQNQNYHKQRQHCDLTCNRSTTVDRSKQLVSYNKRCVHHNGVPNKKNPPSNFRAPFPQNNQNKRGRQRDA